MFTSSSFRSIVIAALLVVMADTSSAQLPPLAGTLNLCQQPDLGAPCLPMPYISGQCASLYPGPFNDNVRSVSTTLNGVGSVVALVCTIYTDDACTGPSVDIPIALPNIPYNVPDNLKNDVSSFKCTITV